MDSKIRGVEDRIIKSMKILESDPIENQELYSKEERDEALKTALDMMDLVLSELRRYSLNGK